MEMHLYLGDEAIAQAAIDAGLSGVYAYPGTPSTEITEYIQHSAEARERKIHSNWSCNEKTAMEAALGMSYAGRRALVCMKHVGLNVAADPFINSAITGANGGLVVVAADDPSMHSSQNEQDSRFYGAFAQVPIFEPANQQEAYDATLAAFELSEKHGVPVLLRLTTRLAHSRANVVRRIRTPREPNPIHFPADERQYVLLPAIARRNYAVLLGKGPLFAQAAEESPFNRFEPGRDRSLGLIACGIADNYIRETYQPHACPHPVLKLGQYPVPRGLLEKFLAACDAVMVFEDGYPWVEEQLRGLTGRGLKVRGRLDGALPRAGELDPAVVARALGRSIAEGPAMPSVVVGRPPTLCHGCPHTNVFEFILDAVQAFPAVKVFSDIGCYTLGALPPHEAINSCVDMGASITMAKGAADAGLQHSLAVIGDSTFAHSGLTGLLDCVEEHTPVTVVISDNLTTGMTGGQKSHAAHRLESIVLGLGIKPEHMHLVTPLPAHHAANVEILKRELEYRGPSVIIARRACLRALKTETGG